jgi:anti-sigma B factor antagonist
MEELETNEASFTIERSSDATGDPLLLLGGELDISSADSFRLVVEEIIGEGPEKLVFDLSQLRFMDSSGIAVMVYAANQITEIELRHASDIVRRVVEATGLSGVLRLDPS